jgi:CheY-like chemotaxis protein/signal transduction histidine kinase
MKTAAQVRELQLQHNQLWNSLRLPETVLRDGTPDFLKNFDLQFARQLLGLDEPWDASNAFEARNRLVAEVFLAADEGRQLHLASEIDLLRKVKETGEDQLHRGPFDILELVLPIKVRGHLVHVMRSGKFRESPLSDHDIKELAFVTGVSAQDVRAAASALPIRTGDSLEAWVNLHKRGRDAVATALEEHVRAVALTGQQLQAERLIAMGTMAEGMAHHFSNLLSVILGYTSLVIDKSTLTPEAAELLRKVTEAAQKGRRFTEEVLTVAGSEDEEESACSLHDRLRGVITLLQSRPGVRADIVAHLDAKYDLVLAPPNVVHQIAFNLLSAALESLHPGSQLTIRTSNSGDAPASSIRIEVSETGATKGASGLSSLKLASLLGHVSRLEGKVDAAVATTPGTKVVVTLPISTEPVAPRSEKKIRRRLAPSSIWVADDDPVVREMCRRVLTADGHSVAEASSGEELKQKISASKTPPDLIIYDYSMPDLDGLELCQDLREGGRRVPVILISGFTAEHPDIKKALKLRKTFLLQKPFSFRDMSDMVTIAMGETLVDA